MSGPLTEAGHRAIRAVARVLDPHFGAAADASPEDLQAFDAHARRLTATTLRTTGLVMAVLLIVAWPTDWLAFGPEGAVRELLAAWRLSVFGVCVIGLLLLRFARPLAERPFGLALVLFALAVAASAALMSRLGGIESPFTYGIYTSPFLTALLFVPLRKRVFATVTLVLLYAVTFVAVEPRHLDHPLVATPAVWLFGVTVTVVVVGHVVYYLLRANFLQRLALDRRAHELQELDRLKNEFFANINHELRTPLANILGALNQVGRERPDGTVHGSVEVGLRNAAHLLGLVDDLLQLARFSSGRATLQPTVVDVAALVRQVAGQFCTGRGDRLVYAAASTAGPLLARVDAKQLRTVVFNLLSNALKFSEPSDPPVELHVRGVGPDVVLSVRDHGIGIPEGEIDRIFERFHRVEGRGQRRRPGVGIGLALVKDIVDQHGGRIDVASVEGQGTTVTVHLPQGDIAAGADAAILARVADGTGGLAEVAAGLPVRPLAARAGEPEPAPADLDPRPLVLVCEDDPDLRNYLFNLLRTRYRVATAADGAEGLDKARALRPQLVLTDVIMPRMSGSDLLLALRADAALCQTPCVFLSALTGSDARVQALREGASDFVRKPFDEVELLARIDNLLRLHDLTRNLETRVAEQTAELSRLAKNLMSVQEEERRRIAREIHDELGQVLTGLGMELDRLRLLREATPDDPARLDEGLGRARELLLATHAAVDDILNALRPPVLESQGLAAALHWLGRELPRRHALQCDIAVDIDEERLSREQSLALYRIVQEAFNNIARHSRAKRVQVTLRDGERGTVLAIRDEGVGFDATEAGAGRQGFGLLGIRERARLIGADCEIASRPGAGTDITLTLPGGAAPLPSPAGGVSASASVAAGAAESAP